MKWIIYFLLICNIGFAAWHFRGLDMQNNTTTSGALVINDESQLVLLSESQQPSNLKTASSAKLCYSLGPFAPKALSGKAQTLLKAKSINTERIRLRDISRSGYWVILPASNSRKEAYKHIKRLKQLKVKDFFLVAAGDQVNAISLGIFSQKKLARRRIDEVIRLGFIPRMERVPLPRIVYWLNWYKESKVQPDKEIIDKIKKISPEISKIERSCK